MNTVKVDRTTRWGNPFRIGDRVRHPVSKSMLLIDGQETAVRMFRAYLRTPAGRVVAQAAKAELRGKNLACWCRDGSCCHADVLLQQANA